MVKERKQIIPLNNSESRDLKLKANKRKWICAEIWGDSMPNGIQEKGLNENADTNIKMRKHPWCIID